MSAFHYTVKGVGAEHIPTGGLNEYARAGHEK